MASEIILPGIRDLGSVGVERKSTVWDPNDVVTQVDLRVEERLTRALPGIDPVPVVGEEGVHANPGLLRLLESDDPLWLLDPIDGTKNLAKGSGDFGVMLAWVAGGRARASWILLPTQSRLYAAEEGAGVVVDGAPASIPTARDRLTGTLHVGYMTKAARSAVRTSLDGHFDPLPDTGCSAIEYTQVLSGVRDFSVYHRLNPWDHAPGALIVTEGGGRVEHADGAEYTPRSPNAVTVVAASRNVSERVRGWLPFDPDAGGTEHE